MTERQWWESDTPTKSRAGSAPSDASARWVWSGSGWTLVQPPAPRRRRGRRAAGAAAAVLLAAGAGAVVGHLTWPTTARVALSSQAATGGSSGSGSSGRGSPGGAVRGGGFSGGNSSGASPFGGFPFGNDGSGAGGSASSPPASGSGGPSDVAAIARGVDPGLVDINTVLSYEGEEAAGTGMVLTSSGEILTNNHVIEGATKITVTDVATGRTYPATVVGYDRTKDVAVLQIDAHALRTVSLGNSKEVAVGESVVGIGNAGGAGGTPRAVGGVVVALDQSITAADAGNGTTERLSGLIETNADIQPGDSGGPLVTTTGKVIGMDTAASGGSSFFGGTKSTATEGFAIPIDEALSIARQIEAHRASASVHIGPTAFLGVEVATGPRTPGAIAPNGGSSGFGGSSDATTGGVPVVGVVEGSPAAVAGIAAGDAITAIDGTPVTSASQLVAVLDRLRPGEVAAVRVTLSSGSSTTLQVLLASGPPQ